MSVTTIDASGSRFSDEARAALAEADVITGLDVNTQREFTVFGTPPLESTVTLKRPSAMRVVQVRIDGSAGSLAKLVALVQDLKGPQHQ